jgi:hypothetical protein
MSWIRRRGNSYALVESHRENGKVRQRYVRTMTKAEAEAWLAASGRRSVPQPSSVREEPAPPIRPPPPVPRVSPDTTPPVMPSPTAIAPGRSPAPPVIRPAWCQMCDVWLALGGALCPRCTGALVRRPELSVCEACQRRIRFGGWQQRFCCQGCLLGQSHTQYCGLG